MRRADRLNNIVQYLRRMRFAVTARQLSEEFGICQRTVYRDIQDLINSGVPIQGAAGVGYIIDKKYHLPPVMFDPDELEAIVLGISMVRSWTDDPFSEKATSALEKIQAVLSESLLHEMQQLATHALPSQSKVPWEVSFSGIRECIRSKRKIRFLYTDLKEKTTTRTIRPLALTFFGPVWLVTGWCETRESFRNFRLDRIRDMDRLGGCFEDERGKTLADFYEQAFSEGHLKTSCAPQ